MEKYRKTIIGSAVLLCLVLAVAMFVETFRRVSVDATVELNRLTAINHFCQRTLAFLLLIAVWNLHKRKFAAWLLTVLALVVSFTLYSIHQHLFGYITMAVQLYCVVVLLVFNRYFRRPARKPSLKVVVTLSILVLVFLLLNAAYGHFVLVRDSRGPAGMWASLQRIFDFLFVDGGTGPYSRFIFLFIWISVGVLVLFILRPIVYDVRITPRDRKRARELVLKYGQNPASYLALEGDKTLFFSKRVSGVIAYGVVGNWIIIQGDPICADEDFVRLLSEFTEFCLNNNYNCVCLGTTDKYLDEYHQMGFEHVKCGEEARFKLDEYKLSGGKMAKMRMNVNHAVKAGLTVEEYTPLVKKDPEIEHAIKKVTDDWMGGKKSGKLVFSVGDVNLDNPMDRRYFYAKDETGRIVGFNVFLPFEGGAGYMADVTRRTHDAPGGVTEKITFDAFMKFKEEGVAWGSLGVSPLANVEEGDNENAVLSKVLEFAYEKGSRFYGFKSLHLAKERYTPSEWIPAYFTFSQKTASPAMALAIIQVQNSGGAWDFITSQVKKPLERIKARHG